MQSYKRPITRSNRKARRDQLLALIGAQVPLKSLLEGVRHDIESIAAEFGMTIIQAIMEEEINSLIGSWGQQTAYRHGSQAGFVVYGGRKVTGAAPRAHGRPARGPIEELPGFSTEGQNAGSGSSTTHSPMLHSQLRRSH